MEAFGISLALLGAASVVAAIAGALNLAGVAEIPAMKSPILRVTLFAVGALFLILGLGFIATGSTPENGGDTVNGRNLPPADGPDQSSGADTGGGSDSANYIAGGNAACSSAGRQIHELKMPAPDAASDLWVTYTFAYADALSSLETDLRLLTPPIQASGAHESLLFHLQQMSSSVESAAIALRAGDPWGYNNHLNSAGLSRADFNRTAKKLSLGACQLA